MVEVIEARLPYSFLILGASLWGVGALVWGGALVSWEETSQMGQLASWALYLLLRALGRPAPGSLPDHQLPFAGLGAGGNMGKRFWASARRPALSA